jgi:hypothetical protein
MIQRCLRFEIIYSHGWNFKNLNATTRQQMALQGKIKKKRVLTEHGHTAYDIKANFATKVLLSCCCRERPDDNVLHCWMGKAIVLKDKLSFTSSTVNSNFLQRVHSIRYFCNRSSNRNVAGITHKWLVRYRSIAGPLYNIFTVLGHGTHLPNFFLFLEHLNIWVILLLSFT